MRPLFVLRTFSRIAIRPERCLSSIPTRLPALLTPSVARFPTGPALQTGSMVVRKEMTSSGSGPGLERIRNWEELSYEELRALVEAGDVLLIDVREPEEVELGKIAGSINIPLGKLIKALYAYTAEEWLAHYNREKPQKTDANIVFYGQATWGMAIKSEAAVKIANRLGFMRARHYIGGYHEWHDRTQKEM